MTSWIDFGAADWARMAQNWTAWWRSELTRPLVVVETFASPRFTFASYSDHIARFGLEAPVEAVIDHFAPQLEALHLFGDAFPKWWPNFGPGVMAAFLGSPVDVAAGTTWFQPSGAASLAEMELILAPDNPWRGRVEAIARAAATRWGERMVIGHTDLGGNLDILASLRGSQALLFDLYDAPDQVEQLSRLITRLWRQCYDEFCDWVAAANRGFSCWGPLWAPGKTYLLQSDFSTMISPSMFERLVLPDLSACCDALDYAFYHLDGKGQIKHLELLLSIPRLAGIQWVPGDGAPPPEEWLPLLKRIRDAGKLCQVYVTLDGALTIAHELGGEGFLFYIVNEFGLESPTFSLDQAQRCCETLVAAGLLE